MKTDDKLKTFSQLTSKPNDYREDSVRALYLAIKKKGDDDISFANYLPKYANSIDELSDINFSYLRKMHMDLLKVNISKKEINDTVAAANRAAEALKKIPNIILRVIKNTNKISRSHKIPDPCAIIEQLEAIEIQINRVHSTVLRGANEHVHRKELIEEIYNFVVKFSKENIPKQGELSEGKNGKEFVNLAHESIFLIATTLEEGIGRNNIRGALKMLDLKEKAIKVARKNRVI